MSEQPGPGWEPDPGWLARDNEPDAGPWNTGLDRINLAEPAAETGGVPRYAQAVREADGAVVTAAAPPQVWAEPEPEAS